jgi:tetratricopeptide (TPR) repeat protein
VIKQLKLIFLFGAIGLLLTGAGCKRRSEDFVAKAKQAETAGDRVNAITYYENAIRTQPADLALRERLVNLLMQESREADAVPHLLFMARNRRDDGALLVRTVNLLLDFGGWKESKELLDAAPATVLSLPEVQEMNAELLAREGKLEPAIKVLTTLIEEAKTPVKVVQSAHLRRGRMLNQMGKSSAALAEFNTVLEKFPDDSEALLLRANLLMVMGRNDDARKAYLDLLQKHPNAHEALIGLASLSVIGNKKDEAITYYQQAQKLAPKDVNILFWLAELHFERHDMAALKLLSDKSEGRKWEREIFQGYLRGLIQMLTGDFTAALKELERLQPLLTTYPGLYDKIGLCHLKLGNPLQAENAFSRINHDEAVQNQVWGALGRGYLAVTNYSRAVRWLEVARDKERIGPLAQAQFGAGDLRNAYKNALLWLQDDPDSSAARLIAAESARRLEIDGQGKVYFEQLARNSPDSPAGVYARAQLLVSSNRLDEAAVLLTSKVTDIEKQSGPTLLLAEISLRLGREAEAEKYLNRTLELDPQSARAHSLFGMLKQSKKDFPAAERHFTSALAADPLDRLALMGKGWLTYDRQEFATSAELFEKAASLRNPDTEAALLWSLSEFGRGDAKRALVAAEKAVALNATNTFARYLEVRGNIATLQWKRATPKALELNRLNPTYGPGYHALALIALSTNDVAQALAYTQAGLKQQPKNLLLQPLEVELLRVLKQTDQAQARLENFRRDFPADPDLFLAEVNLLFDRKEFAQARAVSLKGLAINPADRRLQQRVLDSFVLLKQEKEAAPVLEELLKADPKHDALRFICARLHEIRGEWKAAEDHYRIILENDPKNVASLNNLSIVIGRDPDKLDEALKVAKRAYALDSSNPAVADTLADFMLRAGDVRPARIMLQAASKQAPKNLEIRLHLIEALAAEGNTRDAKKELQQLEQDLPTVREHSKYSPLVTKLNSVSNAK